MKNLKTKPFALQKGKPNLNFDAYHTFNLVHFSKIHEGKTLMVVFKKCQFLAKKTGYQISTDFTCKFSTFGIGSYIFTLFITLTQ